MLNKIKAENSRLQQQITALKGEKTALQQQLIGIFIEGLNNQVYKEEFLNQKCRLVAKILDNNLKFSRRKNVILFLAII